MRYALREYPDPLFFNQQRFLKALREQPKITVFKDAIAGVNSHLAMRFKEGDDVRALVSEHARFIDLLLRFAWDEFEWDDDIALIAVGGYGRGELHPHSDIDLLILTGNDSEKKYSENLQDLIPMLWDIGLAIGSSVRAMDQCIALAKNDISVVTAILESRTIAGPEKLINELQVRTDANHMWPVDAFYEAKVEEQEQRYEKHNHTEYNLEPNIKNAPGGLRDIQTIHWTAKRFYGVRTLTELEGKNFFTEEEYALLHKSETFLWRVRYALHYIAGRAEERLLFEHQREIATLFNYEDTPEQLAVERFMHEYYLAALTIRQLNDVLLQALEEEIERPNNTLDVTPINERFNSVDRHIAVTHDEVFNENPSALLEIFSLLGNNEYLLGIRAHTIRLIQQQKYLIDDKFRHHKENNALFLSLFSMPFGLVTQLRRMSRYGILGRYLPEFGQIIGQMQHDLFHRYTVDAHTLLVIRNMRLFYLPDTEKKFPVANHVMKRLPKPELLYIAGLYHDIGKGRGGDHSLLGAVDAQQFCEQHDINTQETKLIVWLVEKHLLMSYVSQKQDISDPDVIQNFAEIVGSQLRLDYLYVLTIADMCGTNPETWNSWRASLMRQLYTETKRVLRKGLSNGVDKDELLHDTQELALARLSDRGIDTDQAKQIWSGLAEDYFIREGHVDIAWQTELICSHAQADTPLIAIKESSRMEFEGATQLFVHARDNKYVFHIVASCLANLNLNIQDARIHTSSDGFALDTYYLLNENNEPIGDDSTVKQQIIDSLTHTLASDNSSIELVQWRTPRQLKQFSQPSQVFISSDTLLNYSVLEVIGPDRSGVLAIVSQVFIEQNIRLHNARISTLGERIEDIFFITDKNNQALSDSNVCEKLRTALLTRIDAYVTQTQTHFH